MRLCRGSLLLVVSLGTASACGRTGVAAAPATTGPRPLSETAPPEMQPLLALLGDSTIWGREFPAILAYLESWREAGERTLVVFDDTIMGGIQRATRNEAERAASALTGALDRPQRSLRAFAPASVQRASRSSPPFAVAVVRLPDDETLRVGAVAPSLQLLVPSLTIAHARLRLGTPDTVRRELIQSDRDGRPTVLTLYVYARGAVVFAESDLAPRPGFVDRVFLDVDVISAALFREG